MKTNEYYIDFDGVILDTQKVIDYEWSKFGSVISKEWNEYLARIDWNKLIDSSCQINNSLESLKKMLELKKKIYILSRVFSTNEAEAKVNFILRNNLNIPFIFAPNRVEKSKIILPSMNKILIDDSESNCRDWENNNGKSILFSNSKSNDFETIDSLELILKR